VHVFATDEDAASRWHKSTFKEDENMAGEFVVTAAIHEGKKAVLNVNKGFKTRTDGRFFAYYSSASEPFDNDGKDLVVQYSVKHEQNIDCGGAYVKILPESSEMESFGGSTPYNIMFGPDICGKGIKKVHFILAKHDEHGNEKQYQMKTTVKAKTDELTHVYTLVIHPNDDFEILIDGKSEIKKNIEDEFDILEPKEIPDPSATKPEDWDDRKMIEDEDAEKPEGYDDIPENIADPDQQKPDDWDDDIDGDWEPEMIPNPEYKGPWRPPMIENPKYSGGPWEAPMIKNPKYVPKSEPLALMRNLKYVGFDLWQVKAGSFFDNIIITDSLEEAKAFGKKHFGKKSRKREKRMQEDFEEADRKKKDEEADEWARETRKNVEDPDALFPPGMEPPGDYDPDDPEHDEL